MKRFIVTAFAILLIGIFLFGTVGCTVGFAGLTARTCPQCGGTGQYYLPNAYYDGFMWQGMYMTCPQCGGSGVLH